MEKNNVTVLKDAHMTTASASATEDVQAAATVTLTLTPASGYEVADVEVLAGGVTVHQDDSTVSFAMGSSDVVISVTSQKNNEYRISEAALLTLALVGGSAGALLGMLVFRHKIRKPKFVILVPLFLIIHLALAVFFLKSAASVRFM